MVDYGTTLNTGIDIADKMAAILKASGFSGFTDLGSAASQVTKTFKEAETIYVRNNVGSSIGMTFSTTPFKTVTGTTTLPTTNPTTNPAVSGGGGLLGGLGGLFSSPLALIAVFALIMLARR